MEVIAVTNRLALMIAAISIFIGSYHDRPEGITIGRRIAKRYTRKVSMPIDRGNGFIDGEEGTCLPLIAHMQKGGQAC